MAQIWIISDGKPGHLNQSLGLAEALQRRCPQLEITQHAPLSLHQQLASLFSTSAAQVDLLVGAGHATHRSLLLLGRQLKVPAVVLMKPSLPLSWFDLCLIPEHDQPSARANVVPTRGALNRMLPGVKTANSGMLLIGGPSKHVTWHEDRLLAQLQSLIAQQPRRTWQLTTSRRTPESTLTKLLQLPGVEVFPAAETPSGWLPDKLATTEVCWVTEDSVSMIYEALSAGCQVGTLAVEGGRLGRLGSGLQRLEQQALISSLEQVLTGQPMQSATVLDEAGRCAELILQRGWCQ
ncbi:mitochondrial fission ELM1 family protein [Pontibacter sp. JAM-7]|uniref:mitochondrial fission ELM1 family protein n=1 Tax=Pontibacter sp. JAM-7 TaxID=3366581 RepID=UPI003AF9B4E8